MPFPGGVFTSSAGGDIGGGKPYTAFNRGPVLFGSQQDSAATGPLIPPGGVIPVQSTGILSTASARVSHLYIAASTMEWVGSTGAPPYSAANQAALMWDDSAKKLFIYSPASAAWFQAHNQTTGGTLSWSASSS